MSPNYTHALVFEMMFGVTELQLSFKNRIQLFKLMKYTLEEGCLID